MANTHTIELTRLEIVALLNDARRNKERWLKKERHEAIEKLESTLDALPLPRFAVNGPVNWE
jgi:hypothetical protein|tara:strand:- start:356 stop:541 length:186 start_codon:yes stop_codon:yes gene_type:complete